MSSVGYHEPIDELSDVTRDMHRAIVSLMEELEAVDWYNQRADACKDAELKAILEHNRDEEKEHASMVLEWIRRERLAVPRDVTVLRRRRGSASVQAAGFCQRCGSNSSMRLFGWLGSRSSTSRR